MMIHAILWSFLFGLCFLSLSGSEIPQTESGFKEPCVEGICERGQTLAERLSDEEQQNGDIPEGGAYHPKFDHFDSGIGNEISDQSSCTSCEESSKFHSPSHLSDESLHDGYSDENSAKLEIVGFHKNEDKDRFEVNSDLGTVEVEDKEILPLNELNENYQEEPLSPELEVVGFDKVHVDKNSNEEIVKKENSESQLPRRRYFPLLYTIRTLLNSLLSEFGDDSGSQETSFNSSDTTSGNFTVPEDQVKDLNTTTNGTDSSKKTRFQCAVKNITSNVTGEVKIVNSTELLEILNFSKNQKVSPCVLVMFHAPWCHFCARAAAHYNALARAFPQLDVLAVDTSHFSYLNARFGTVAVPNVMLFHARSAVRFNHTSRLLENFIQFVTNNTGLEPDMSVKLEPEDFLGPLPSVVVRGRDWLLCLAWTFVIICSAYGFVRSHYGQSFITWLRVLWQEHQHIE